jgi:hypothetical protein
MNQELRRALDRNQELEEILGQNDDLRIALASAFGLTGIQAGLVGLLMQRQGVTDATAHAVLFGRRPERSQPGMKVIRVHLVKCRRKLKCFGVEISTLWGVGFQLDATNKKKIHELLADA